ncbi:MAG: amidase family protein [Desertimonas sp.]
MPTVDHDRGMGDVTALSATEQRQMLADKQISARELFAAHVARIEQVNHAVNAVVAFDPTIGQRRAAALDDAIAGGADAGPLAGLVTAHKDLTETADFPTTYGAAPLAGFRPRTDSQLVARMTAAGAVAVGKTNTPEFGAGSHSFNPVYGVTRNPYDLTRSAGGSSGGAAAALACGMVAIADGSDMGGSLRNPAAWNNVVGFRPSPRVVPSAIATNPWSPLATEGPMGRTVDDVRLLLSVIGRPDRRDPLSRAIDIPDRLDPPPSPLRVAWSRDLGGVPMDPDQVAILARVRPSVEELGWAVTDDEPDFTGADDCFITLRAWGFATGPTGQLGDRLAMVKPAIGDEVARGSRLTPQQIADALAHLGVMWRRTQTFFDRYDVLLAPVTQVAPFPAEWEYPTEIDGTALARYTTWMAACFRVTVMGAPALSLPAGFDDAGRPVGIQIIGRPGDDVTVLRAAAMLEAVTDHARRRPDLGRLTAAGPAGYGPPLNHPATA